MRDRVTPLVAVSVSEATTLRPFVQVGKQRVVFLILRHIVAPSLENRLTFGRPIGPLLGTILNRICRPR